MPVLQGVIFLINQLTVWADRQCSYAVCNTTIWSYVCMFVIFIIFFYLFICHLLIWNISFFPFLLLNFLRKFQLNYTHELYTDTLFIIVSYFVNTFYCTNSIFFHEIFSVFQLTFSCFHHNLHLYTFTW